RLADLDRVVVLQHDRAEKMVAPVGAGGAGQDVLPEEVPLGPGPDVIALEGGYDVSRPVREDSVYFTGVRLLHECPAFDDVSASPGRRCPRAVRPVIIRAVCSVRRGSRLAPAETRLF